MKSISSRSFIQFNEQLAAMVALDLPMPESLRRASGDMGDPRLARTVAALAREIEKGSSLSSAVSNHPGELPEVYAAMIKAGEASGNLAQVLRQMSSYSHDMHLLKSRAKASLIYPAMLSVMFLGLMMVFSFLVAPAFENIFGSFDAELPSLTRFVLDIGDAFAHPSPLAVAALALLAAAAFMRRSFLKEWWDGFQLRLPWWGDFALSTLISRACATLGVLLDNGVPLVDALTLTQASSDNRVVRAALDQARDAVTRGEKAGSALAKTGVFPKTFTWLLTAAEERGDFDSCLQETGAYHARRADRIAKAMALALGPAMIAACGLVFGTVVIAMFLPMFSLGSLVK